MQNIQDMKDLSNNAKDKIDKMTVANESRETFFKWLYLILMGLLLLSYPYMMLTYTYFVPYNIPIWIWVLRFSCAVLAIGLGKLWKDKGCWILAVYFLWIILRMLIPDSKNLFSQQCSEVFITGIWTFTACYGMARILTPQELKRVLRICAAIWVLAMTISSTVGIIAAWQDKRVYTWGNAAFWGIYPKRLMMPYLPTTSSALTSFSSMVALCALVCEKKRAIKILYGIATAIITLALSLTDSRTGFISFAVGTAALIFVCLIWRQKSRVSYEQQKKTLKFRKFAVIIVTAMVVFAGTILVLMFAEREFHYLRVRGSLLINNALAESTETEVFGRGFSGGTDMLTGRFELWIGTLKYLKQNPLVLLIGEGKIAPMNGIQKFTGHMLAHTHNMPLMILVESGIPGLLMVLAFVLYTARNYLKGFRAGMKLVPFILVSIILSIMAGDMVECFAWMQGSYLPLLQFMVFTAGIYNAIKSKTMIQNGENI